jgi:hypothetical protein
MRDFIRSNPEMQVNKSHALMRTQSINAGDVNWPEHFEAALDP